MKTLDGLRWRPRWVSHLGCLEYLGVEISDAWLYGATGHAFVINIHEALCPSGPTAWKSNVLDELGEAIGCRIERIEGDKRQPGFADVQERAWEATQRAIHERIPVYGWELDVPEYYVVNGYDDVGYYYNGPLCDDGAGPKPWRELGVTDIGWLAMYVVRLGQTKGDAAVVKQALDFAVAMRDEPRRWALDHYAMGLEAYDWWIKALDEGGAGGLGMAYNAAVWAECRHYAAEFLVEARLRLQRKGSALPDAAFIAAMDAAFIAAIEAYSVVADNLRAVSELFPFMVPNEEKDQNVSDPDCCAKGLLHLRSAKTAEAHGLHALEQIAAAL